MPPIAVLDEQIADAQAERALSAMQAYPTT